MDAARAYSASAYAPARSGASSAFTPATAIAQGGKNRDPKLWKVAQNYESMFLENVMKQMTSGLTGEGPLGTEGDGGEIWRGMLVDQYAQKIGKTGGVGIADNVYRELIRVQEGA
jgi:Rod binding domain-containing protein